MCEESKNRTEGVFTKRALKTASGEALFFVIFSADLHTEKDSGNFI
jgi:hypothetical protein